MIRDRAIYDRNASELLGRRAWKRHGYHESADR
jgi:hypothetical protein